MLVIGNGESRKGIDIGLYKGTKIGCNAIYRDFSVDHLICCDKRMVIEAQSNGYKGTIYTRKDWLGQLKGVELVPQLPYNGASRPDDPWHWGSGPYAVLLAARLSNGYVDMIGFDLHSDTPNINNVYKDTLNYDKSNKRAIDPSYWIYQIGKIIQHFPEVVFRNYNKNIWPDKYNNLKNYDIGVFNVS